MKNKVVKCSASDLVYRIRCFGCSKFNMVKLFNIHKAFVNTLTLWERLIRHTLRFVVIFLKNLNCLIWTRRHYVILKSKKKKNVLNDNKNKLYYDLFKLFYNLKSLLFWNLPLDLELNKIQISTSLSKNCNSFYFGHIVYYHSYPDSLKNVLPLNKFLIMFQYIQTMCMQAKFTFLQTEKLLCKYIKQFKIKNYLTEDLHIFLLLN